MNLLRLFGCYLNEYLSLVDSPLTLSIRSRSIELFRFPSPRHLNFTFRISHHIAIVIISHRARKEVTLAQPVKLFNTFAGCSVIVRSEREKRIELRIFSHRRRIFSSAEPFLVILVTSPGALWQNGYAPNVFICFIVMSSSSPAATLEMYSRSTPILNHSFLKRTNIGYWCYQRCASQCETMRWTDTREKLHSIWSENNILTRFA